MFSKDKLGFSFTHDNDQNNSVVSGTSEIGNRLGNQPFPIIEPFIKESGYTETHK